MGHMVGIVVHHGQETEIVLPSRIAGRRAGQQWLDEGAYRIFQRDLAAGAIQRIKGMHALGEHQLGASAQHGVEQALLGRKVVMDKCAVHVGEFGDLADRDAVKAAFGKEILGGIKNAVCGVRAREILAWPARRGLGPSARFLGRRAFCAGGRGRLCLRTGVCGARRTAGSSFGGSHEMINRERAPNRASLQRVGPF